MSSGYNPPPWQPPSNQLNPLAILNLLQEKQKMEMQQQAMQEERQKTATDQYLKAVAAGLDPEVVAPNIPDLGVAGYNLGLETAKQLKKQKALEEAQSKEALSGFAGSVSPTLDTSGKIVPPSPETLGAAQEFYNSLANLGPEGFELQRKLSMLRAAQEQAVASTGSEIRARESSQIRQSAADVGMREASARRMAVFDTDQKIQEFKTKAELTERQALKEENRKTLGSALSGSVVALRTKDITRPEFDAGIQAALKSGYSIGDIMRGIYKAEVSAPTELARLRREATSVDKGRTVVEQTARDMKDSFAAAGFDVSTVADADWRLLGAGKAFIDPVAHSQNRIIIEPEPAGSTAANARIEARHALMELNLARGSMERSWLALEDAVKAGKIPFVGAGIPTKVSDVMTFLGQGSPEAEVYKNTSFMLVAKLVKMMQGSRPSDFDVRSYLALMPTLQEAGSRTGTGIAKVKSLGEMIDQSMAIRGRQTGRGIPSINPDSARNSAIGQKLSSLVNPDGSVNVDAATKFIADDLPRWQATEGRGFAVPTLAPESASRAAGAVDRVFGPGGK